MKRYVQLAPLAIVAHALLLTIRMTPTPPLLPKRLPLQELQVSFAFRPPVQKETVTNPVTPPADTPSKPETVIPATQPPLPPVQKQVAPTLVMEPQPVAEVSESKGLLQEIATEKNDSAPPEELTPDDRATPLIQNAFPLTAVNPPPLYPRRAKRRGLQGEALLDVLVDSSGLVAQVQVASSTGHAILDKAAMQAMWNWRFQPGSTNGLATEMWVRVPVRFQLK